MLSSSSSCTYLPPFSMSLSLYNTSIICTLLTCIFDVVCNHHYNTWVFHLHFSLTINKEHHNLAKKLVRLVKAWCFCTNSYLPSLTLSCAQTCTKIAYTCLLVLRIQNLSSIENKRILGENIKAFIYLLLKKKCQHSLWKWN